MRLLRNLGVVSSLTLLSRLLGFAREILTANYLGAGPVADTFFQALTIPNTFRRVLAEGAFNSAFVPLYAKQLEGADKASADAFASDALSVLFTVTFAIVVLFQIAAPWLAYIFFPGDLQNPEGLAFGAFLLQITMPYLLAMAVTALIGGVLNTHGRFAIAAAAPVLFNLVLIVILALDFAEGKALAVALAIGVTTSGLLQAILLWAAAKASGLKIRLKLPRVTPQVRRLIALGVPGAVAAGATQINILVTSSIAMFETGARSYLNYAERLYQLPLGVIGIAMGVALLPTLARRIRNHDDENANFITNRALELSLALTLPAAVAFLVIPEFLVQGIYERGAFNETSSSNTAIALAAYAVGLPAFVLVKVLAPGFFAREDTQTPMKIALGAVGLNLALALALFFGGLGFLGLAIATAAAGWFNAALLGVTLRMRGYLKTDIRLWSRLARVVIACAVMGAGVYILVAQMPYLTQMMSPYIGESWSNVAMLLFVVAVGAVIYASFCLVTGAVKISEISQALRPGKADPATPPDSGVDL
jgi:putative peptidoglycan lipid II flippase